MGHKLDAAWAKSDPALALAALKAIAASLEADHPGAASSLREGMEETLTVTGLGVPPTLMRTLSSTNPIESAYSVAREVMGNVKRWRQDAGALDRCRDGGCPIQIRRIKGYRELPILINKLASIADESAHSCDKVA